LLCFRLTLAIVAGFAMLAVTPLAIAQESISIRTDFTPAGTHGALHLALVKGWFKEAGLDVDLQDGKGSINTLQTVATSAVDFAQLSVSLVPTARQSGMKVVSVACFARRTDFAVLVPEGSPMKRAQDLKGKKLVVFPQSPWIPIISTFLHNAGLENDQVTILTVDANAMFAVYSSGQADAVMTLGPFSLPILEKTRPSRAFDAADYGINLPALGLVTREDVISSRPETVRKVVAITIRAWKYIRDGHVDEAVQAIIHDRPDAQLDPKVLAGQINAYFGYFETPNTKGKPIGWQSDEDWAAAVKLLTDANVIKPGAKISDMYTNKFIPD
jgi:NitT/TauT family transport system substrate-binding protein